MTDYKNWDLKIDESNCAWCGFDRAGATLNSLNEVALDELDSIITAIAAKPKLIGLIIYSKKEKGFIAGADIKSIANLKSAAEVEAFLKKGHTVLEHLANLKIPTVAMIHGFCMGGGTELVLACDYRIASDDLETKIGLPEILLGFHPGWAGTIRLQELIGGFAALSNMTLSGAAISASRAKNLGVVDAVVPLRQLKRAAIAFINNKPEKHKPTLLQKLSDAPLIRNILAKILYAQVAKKVSQEHYPAPYALINLWEQNGKAEDEIKSVTKLATESSTTPNLIRLFQLREKLKEFAKGSNFTPKHIHIVGAGLMGGDIAAWCALKGFSVTLQDQNYEKIAPAIGRAYALYKKKLKKPRLIQAAMDRLQADPNGYGIKRADVFIEAVFENLKIKQEIFKNAEKQIKKGAILATNTSSIPLTEISSVLKNPNALIGIHFFNPVSRMDLVEVVYTPDTPAEILNNACSFVNKISKLPLPVKSSPGFLVNRVLMPYLMECVQLLSEGYKPELIDLAAKKFGMMMGPVELADTVGMDVCLAVAENLTAYFGGSVPDKLKEQVAAGKLGRKTGEGFYKYKKGKPVKAKISDTEDTHDIADRLILRIINESAACLREGVVADADLLDAGMVFGTGFAPFRGGPMNYAKQYGEDKLNKLFEKLTSKHGERFKKVSI